MVKAKTQNSYEVLKTELDEIMSELQREDIGVDKALENYKRGLELVQEIEAYLKSAENKVSELKAGFNNKKT